MSEWISLHLSHVKPGTLWKWNWSREEHRMYGLIISTSISFDEWEYRWKWNIQMLHGEILQWYRYYFDEIVNNAWAQEWTQIVTHKAEPNSDDKETGCLTLRAMNG